LQSETTYVSKDDGKCDRRLPPLRRAATAWHMRHSLFSGIGRRLLVRVLLFSSVITLLLTMMQLYLDYRRDVQAIDLRMSEIESGYRQSLGGGLWQVDEHQLQLQVEGIFHLPDISYVELREATDQAYHLMVTAGSHKANPPARREFRIFYTNRGTEQLVGFLVVEATFDRIYRRLLDAATVIMVGQAIKTFIVSLFTLLLVQRLITRHLTAIATSLRGYDLRGSQAPLRLERRPPRPADELEALVGAFNQMYARLQVAHGDLMEREAKVRRLVDSNIIGICIFDLDRRILEANDAFLRIVGYDRDDLVSQNISWADMTPPEWRERDHQQLLPELMMTGSPQPFEKEFFRKDGSRVPVLIGVANFEEDGQQGVAFVLDLTERKNAADALSALQTDLAHANRLTTMGQLAASIAHEVNQPIGAARNNAHAALRFLAREPPDLAEAREALDCVVSETYRAGDILGGIREQIKKVPPRRELFDLSEAIEEVIKFVRGELLKQHVSVQMQLTQGLPLVQGDRVQLQQVVLNLIVNAIEAMTSIEDDPRELVVSTKSSPAEGLLVAVSDSGPGVAAKDRERIFESFVTTKPAGVGIGLSICRSIIEAHGGRLWADQHRPRGAVFRFTLPAHN
jgi:PAS domain S-box-containing protein